jgi:hypothetical protein
MNAQIHSLLGRNARRVVAVAVAGLMAAGCAVGSPAVTPPPKAVPSAGRHSATTTTTPTISSTLPECGATRDPLDPTDSSAPDC